MPRSESCFNVLLGISILSWAVLGFAASTHQRPVSVQVAISALHLCVAALIIGRARAEKHGSVFSSLASLPALLISGWSLRLAPSSWNVPAQIIFCAGASLAIVGFLYLGRCFAILPAVRGTVTRGPFRIIRHPAYLGELSMVAGCWLAAPGWINVWPLLLVVPLVALRIVSEESVMAASPAYTAYTDKVRWRLIPLLW